MNAVVKPLPQLDYFDPRKEAPFRCRCGHRAPADITEYYRHYHILGCARCGRQLAMVDHPTPAEAGLEALPQWVQAA